MIRRMLSLAAEQWLVLAVVTISLIVQSAGHSPTRDFHVSIRLQQTSDTRVANMRAEMRFPRTLSLLETLTLQTNVPSFPWKWNLFLLLRFQPSTDCLEFTSEKWKYISFYHLLLRFCYKPFLKNFIFKFLRTLNTSCRKLLFLQIDHVWHGNTTLASKLAGSEISDASLKLN